MPRATALGLLTLVCLAPALASGSGFMVSKMGGDTSGPTEDNAASVFWNPAAIGTIEAPGSLLLDVNMIWRSLDFERTWPEGYEPGERPSHPGTMSTYDTLPMLAGTARPGLDWLTLGLAFYVPFGHRSDWPSWDIELERQKPAGDQFVPAQAFHTLQGGIKTLFTTAAASFRVADWLWLGGGVSWVYALVDSTRARDFSQEILPGILPIETVEYSGLVELDFAGHGWAWSLGALARPSARLRLGLSFTSGVDLDLAGSARIGLPPVLEPTYGPRVDSRARFGMRLPPVLRAGLHLDCTDWLVFRLVVETAFWSDYDEVVVSHLRFENADGPVGGTLGEVREFRSRRDYRDAIDIRAGFRFFPVTWWMLYVGGGYDMDAAPTVTTTPDLYDAPKFGLAGGTRFQVVPLLEWLAGGELGRDDWVALSLGLTWVRYLHKDVERSEADPPITGGYEHAVWIFNTNVDVRF
ncbi:MAG TPA: outer membrane protein transport protein [Myxococcota bacterium]|nr:outer membrane protein transport protein [Myxococcota bacterium]HRY94906.1 outer membrane protein transport protein [Myxococcota bacterium]HSA21816.1 outer membrane protein transport protein [Myxococcota bacterium]